MANTAGIKTMHTLPHLAAWRNAKGLTHRALSELCAFSGKHEQIKHVSPGTIIRIEQGHPTNYITIIRLAKGLGISPEQLVNGPPEA